MPKNATAADSKPKRPKRAPMAVKRQTFTLRLADATRDRARQAAETAGRSMSEELELRIEQSFRDESLYKSLLGGGSAYRLLRYAATIMETSRASDGSGWENDPEIANAVGMALYYLTISCSGAAHEAHGMLMNNEELNRRVLYAAQLISNHTMLSYGANLDPAILEGRERAITAPQAIQRFIVDGEKV